MSGPQAKGVAFRGIVEAVKRICPPGTVDKMLPLLPSQVAPAVEHDGFLAAGWYPLPHYRAIFEAVMRATGRGLDLVAELSREATKQDFRGIYRVLTFIISPEFLMRRAGGLFNRYYDTGALIVPVAKHGYAEAQYRGCVGFDRVLWEDALAGSGAILEVCGAKDLEVTRLRGGGDGDVDMDVVARWK
jgi:hypothetical protein